MKRTCKQHKNAKWRFCRANRITYLDYICQTKSTCKDICRKSRYGSSKNKLKKKMTYEMNKFERKQPSSKQICSRSDKTYKGDSKHKQIHNIQN